MKQTAWHVPDDAHYRERHRMPGHTAPHGGHPHNLTAAGKIVEGSVVRLKSGGPVMTVSEVEGSFVRVVCFSGDDKVIREELPVTALEFVRA